MRLKGLPMTISLKKTTTPNLTAVANALQNCRRLTESEVTVYVDTMLQISSGAGDKNYRTGSSLLLFISLSRFLDSAIACDLEKLKSETTINSPKNMLPIWRHLELVNSYFKLLYTDDFDFCPTFKLFFNRLRQEKFRVGPRFIFSNDLLTPDKNRWHLQRLAFIDLVSDIQSEAKRINLSKKMQKWQFPVDSNIVRVNAFAEYLFQRYQQISVISLRISYPQSSINDGNDLAARLTLLRNQQCQDQQAKIDGTKPHGSDSALPVVPPDTLKRDLRFIFDGIKSKRSLFKKKIGHAISLEWSRASGHYARVMFFFDGAVSDELSDQIGDYFIERTTGRMAYVNCNRAPELYPETGLLQIDDCPKREHLLRRLLYWAQKHQLFSIKASTGFRTFTTSDIPQAWKTPDQLINRMRKPSPMTVPSHLQI